jgi:mono/diheme cytochrome c family protein
MMKISAKVLIIPGIALLVAGGTSFALSNFSDGAKTDYENAVLATTGDVHAGKTLFNANCSACHGTEANGWIGPNLHSVKTRKTDVAIIRQIDSGLTPPMPKFELNERQMADILSYLKSI